MVLGIGKSTPNPIDTINIPGFVGAIGLVACPGIRVTAANPSKPKNLDVDLDELIAWGANGVVCFLEPHELVISKIEELPQRIESSGMWWRQLPIVDMGIPDQEFEDNWAEEGELIRHALRGMMAARILVEMGMDAESAIIAVRQKNRRRIQNDKQETLVRTSTCLYER